VGVVKTQAAVLLEPDARWQITELELDPPRDNEVLIRFMASGLCHSDEHVRSHITKARLPMIGGHEGAGIIEAVGPGVTRVAKGDHVICSYIPVCGRCRYCSTGHQNLCDVGLNAMVGCLIDGTYRFHLDGQDVGAMCVLGTFSQYAVISELSVVKIAGEFPFEVGALLGCGVPTGWGSSVYAAGVRAGETVVVYGVGGVGVNAVQGARYAGAKNVVAVDPLDFKLEMAQVAGATHIARTHDEAREMVVQLTWGELADHAIITADLATAELTQQAVDVIGKGGDVVVTSVADYDELSLQMSSAPITGWQRRIQGALFGASNPLYDIPRMLELYRRGELKVSELITQRYRLDEVNEGYEDLLEGKNIRGVLVHEH
jgi:S-(hydroxymethyl)glutathione dehydrogenase/alcohol dehydrogenase